MADDDDLYDEFGNYIGPDLHSSSSEEEEENGKDEASEAEKDSAGENESTSNGIAASGVSPRVEVEAEGAATTSLVLHEDKKYYPDADEVYPDAEVLVQDEDAQSIEAAIIAPVKRKAFSLLEAKAEERRTVYSEAFMLGLVSRGSLIRNIAVLGHFHHGKTTLCDVLVEQTLEEGCKFTPGKQMRYLDARVDEQDRELSIKATAACLVLPDSNGKHYVVNVMDTPGHVNFAGECTAALRVADGAVVVVDAVEGVMMNTKRLIRHAAAAGASIMLCISKLDRLVHELKLPPTDAYFKLLFIIDQVNSVLKTCSDQKLCPRAGNVCFSSASDGWCFTLASFASIYVRWYKMDVDPIAFAKRLWGEVYYNPATRKFVNKIADQRSTADANGDGVIPDGMPRSFVHFILRPIYKLYAQVLGEEPHVLKKTLRSIGIKLSAEELTMDAKPLLKLVFAKFFEGQASGFVDMLVGHCASPKAAAEHKTRQTYTGPIDPSDPFCASMLSCDRNGPLAIQVVKLYSTVDASDFVALGRILSGTVKRGQKVRVLGENYSLQDDEDMAKCVVTGIGLSQGRTRLDVDQLPAGNWVLLDGVAPTISKTATIVSDDEAAAKACIFKPLAFNSCAVVKLAIEPLNPSELPKMLAGLRSVNKSYLLLTTKVEESGEHVIYGTGELFLDCVMHDLREMYAEIEIKVSDPIVSFRETVLETSSLKCSAVTPNQKNRLSFVAEPLEKGLAEELESGKVSLKSWSKQKISKYFMQEHKWDILASRSIWAFGPEDDIGSNILLDDTLPGDVDKELLGTVKSNIVQGFKWGCREGPLCDEPIRAVKFKLFDVALASEALHRGGGQVIPTTRRVLYSSFLTASPRLMEPVFSFEIQCPAGKLAIFALRKFV